MTHQQDATGQTQQQGSSSTNAQGQANDDEAIDVQVDQEPAEVKVQQESSDITVEQSQPDVTVEQGGEPDVNVEQADDAKVDANNGDEQERQPADQDSQGQNNSLMALQVSDLEGMTVVNQEGEEIGDIQHIAQHNDSGDLYAIISVGGIWGFGATDIALPVDEMQVENDQLVMNTSYGSDEIEQSSEEYNEDSYTQVDSEMTLSETQQQQQ